MLTPYLIPWKMPYNVICFSVDPSLPPTLPHCLHFAPSGRELFTSNYWPNTAHTYSCLLCQPCWSFHSQQQTVWHYLIFSFDLLSNRIPSVCLETVHFRQWTAAGEGYGFCCQPLLDNQLSTVGRQPLSFVAAGLAVLQGLNGFLLTSDVELIPVTKVESLWIYMQQQYFQFSF